MRKITILIISLLLITLYLSGCSQKAVCDSYEVVAEIYFQAVQDNDLDAIDELNELSMIAAFKEDGGGDADSLEYYLDADHFYGRYYQQAIDSIQTLSTQIISPSNFITHEGEPADAMSATIYRVAFSSGKTCLAIQLCYSIDNQWYYEQTIAYPDNYSLDFIEEYILPEYLS